MSYSDYNLVRLRHDFGLKVRDQVLFEPIGTLEPSSWFMESLKNGQDLAVSSEKARGEFIVAPVLMACRVILGHDLRIFSGVRLDVDPNRGLNGECDFLVARSESSLVFQAPLMVLLEAKKSDFEVGLGQCAAQLLGARLYREKEGKAVARVYGCGPTGYGRTVLAPAAGARVGIGHRLQLLRQVRFRTMCCPHPPAGESDHAR